MAFRFNEASSGTIAAFAEDYRVVRTADGCHLTWVMAMKPKGLAGRIGMTLGRPVMARMFQKFRYNLRDYSDKRFATACSRELSADRPRPSGGRRRDRGPLCRGRSG
jgi:hypothetical protein